MEFDYNLRIDENEFNSQKETIIHNIIEINSQKENKEKNLEIEKIKLIEKLTIQISSCENVEQLKTIKNIVAPIEPTLLAIKETKEDNKFTDKNSTNKIKITKQRIYSTKKTMKQNAKRKYNNSDLINSAINLLKN